MTIRERQILSGMDIKARTGDEIALKAAIANAQKDSGGGDGGGSSGGGITVIECEIFKENEHTYLRNAGQLVAAIDDIEKNPAHFVNYALVLADTTTQDPVPPYFLCYAMSMSSGEIGFRDSENIIVSGSSKTTETGFYLVNFGFNFVFEGSDVDENGIATLSVNDL